MGGLTGSTAEGPSSREMPLTSDQLAKGQDLIKTLKALNVTPNWVISGLEADKPTAQFANRVYISTDTQKIWLDTGTTWIQIYSFLTGPGDTTKFLRGDTTPTWVVPPSTAISTQSDVTVSRVIGTVYQNTLGKPIFVSAYGVTSSSTTIYFYTDSSNPPTLITASIYQYAVGGNVFVCGWVLPNNYYKVVGTSITLTKWIEWY